MSTPKATISQAEVRRYLRAMREARFDEGRIEIERPDGTKVSIVAGKASENTDPSDDIDAMIQKVPNAIS